MKIAAFLIVAALAVVHLIFRDYPFGGAGQTILDILLVAALAVTIGFLLLGKASTEQEEAAPPKTADQKPNKMREQDNLKETEEPKPESGKGNDREKK